MYLLLFIVKSGNVTRYCILNKKNDTVRFVVKSACKGNIKDVRDKFNKLSGVSKDVLDMIPKIVVDSGMLSRDCTLKSHVFPVRNESITLQELESVIELAKSMASDMKDKEMYEKSLESLCKCVRYAKKFDVDVSEYDKMIKLDLKNYDNFTADEYRERAVKYSGIEKLLYDAFLRKLPASSGSIVVGEEQLRNEDSTNIYRSMINSYRSYTALIGNGRDKREVTKKTGGILDFCSDKEVMGVDVDRGKLLGTSVIYSFNTEIQGKELVDKVLRNKSEILSDAITLVYNACIKKYKITKSSIYNVRREVFYINAVRLVGGNSIQVSVGVR